MRALFIELRDGKRSGAHVQPPGALSPLIRAVPLKDQLGSWVRQLAPREEGQAAFAALAARRWTPAVRAYDIIIPSIEPTQQYGAKYLNIVPYVETYWYEVPTVPSLRVPYCTAVFVFQRISTITRHPLTGTTYSY